MPLPDVHDIALTLPFYQRVELAQDLWDSVHADATAAPFTEEQLAEIDRRIAAADAGEFVGESWQTVHRRILSEL